MQINFANLYLDPFYSIAISVPLLYVYHCYTCTIAIHVPLLYVYHCYMCTIAIRVPLLYVYHCYTCTIAIRVPLLYVYPFYSNCNSRHPLSKLANAGSTLSILSQNWSIVINCPKSLTSRHQATCYRLW